MRDGGPGRAGRGRGTHADVTAVAPGRTRSDVLGLENDDLLAGSRATLAREEVGQGRAREAGADDEEVGLGRELARVGVRVEAGRAAVGALPVRDAWRCTREVERVLASAYRALSRSARRNGAGKKADGLEAQG